MLESAILGAVAIVALAAWDVARRHYAARKVDDRAEIEALTEERLDNLQGIANSLAERVKKLEDRVTQIQNRPTPKRALNRLG